MMENYILDSCAMIALIRKEQGGERVKIILDEAAQLRCNVSMHNASVAEIYYDTIYFSSIKDAEQILQNLGHLPLFFIYSISSELITWIGYFKTRYRVSFADCFVLATAKVE